MCKRRERLESELAIDEYIEVVVVLIRKRNCKTGFGGEQKSTKEVAGGQSPNQRSQGYGLTLGENISGWFMEEPPWPEEVGEVFMLRREG
jgi:hypothetical protein